MSSGNDLRREGAILSLKPACALVLASFCLLSLSFPPFDAGWVGFVALVPWLYAVMRARLRDALLLSWLLGLIFYTVNLYWIGYVTIVGWLSLSVLYLSLYFLVFGVLARLFSRRLTAPAALLLPPVWVGLEFARNHLLTGFPWFSLGHSQYRFLPVIQIADVSSLHGVSFLLVAVNASLAEGFAWRALRRPVPAWRKTFAVACPLFLVAAALGYGHFRLATAETSPGPKVYLVQGNIPQSLKLEPESAEDILTKYMDLTNSVLGSGADLIVWPETMVPYVLNRDLSLQEKFAALARRANANLLLGSVSLEGSGVWERKYNSALYIRRDGGMAGRYDKMHLVPFGEYIPLRRYLPFLRSFMPYDPGFSPGRNPALFELGDFTFGVTICYEDTLPGVVRRLVAGRSDILVNITNDGWFQGSPELEQHFAIAVFRAVENRVPLVRGANTGISGFVEPTGKIQSVLRDASGRAKEVAGTLCGSVVVWKDGDTFYERHGDVVAWICVVWAGAALLASLILPAVLPPCRA